MPGAVLTTSSTILCPHGGRLTLSSSSALVDADGSRPLLETDVHPVTGCPFTLPGPKASPCVRVVWSAGSRLVTVDGTPVLVATSVGRCESAEGAVQGQAVVEACGNLLRDEG